MRRHVEPRDARYEVIEEGEVVAECWSLGEANMIASGPEVLEALQRALKTLEDAGNHLDHDNAHAAQQVLARYFELWSEDDRAIVAQAERRS
jgi:hypothetical protein